jgi:hypothetical protein
VGFEDAIWVLWLHLVEVSCQLFVVLAQFFLSDDLVDFVILAFIWISLSSEHEGHLLKSNLVIACSHDFTD